MPRTTPEEAARPDRAGIIWKGIAALAYEEWAAAMNEYLPTSQPPRWEHLMPHQQVAWIAAAQTTCDVFARAMLA